MPVPCCRMMSFCVFAALSSACLGEPVRDNGELFVNRLASEGSPYLQQHKHNPVDWFPWGEEAFEKAIREDKPIFLSIGYSTCHWCHVMERESFEDPEIGEILNEHFVSIKVDREERPDIDRIYMAFVQSQTGKAGWPLNVFLTPGRDPFFGGTYFPVESRRGLPAFRDVLLMVAEKWSTDRATVLERADRAQSALEDLFSVEPSGHEEYSEALYAQVIAALKNAYDPEYGGFGSAAKFPIPAKLRFLLAEGVRQADKEAVEMVLETCRQMAAGGIYDQLGGGFSRYTVDEKWRIPHFEKMLYDNAQLIDVYIDSYLVSGEKTFLKVARETADYVLSDLSLPGGGFASAEDADSEGHEGKFYCWTYEELKAVLEPAEFLVIEKYYGIRPEGNFFSHSRPDALKGLNVLYRTNSPQEEKNSRILEAALSALREERAKRVRPHRDNKVLSSWNGLMIGSLARLGTVSGDDRYTGAAYRCLSFIRKELWDADSGTLYHRWMDGNRDSTLLLIAYAYLADGVLTLYESTLDVELLEFAIELAGNMVRRFGDDTDGGFFEVVDDGSQILALKEVKDGVMPSGNSVAIDLLFQLAVMTEDEDFMAAAKKSLEAFAPVVTGNPFNYSRMLEAARFTLEEPDRVVLAGKMGSKGMLEAIHDIYLPHKVVLGTAGPVEPFARSLPDMDGRATVYICTGTSCSAPTTDPGDVKALISGN